MNITDDLRRALEIVPVEWEGSYKRRRLVFHDRMGWNEQMKVDYDWVAVGGVHDHEAEALIEKALREWLEAKGVYVRPGQTVGGFSGYQAFILCESRLRCANYPVTRAFDISAAHTWLEALVAAVLAVDGSDDSLRDESRMEEAREVVAEMRERADGDKVDS